MPSIILSWSTFNNCWCKRLFASSVDILFHRCTFQLFPFSVWLIIVPSFFCTITTIGELRLLYRLLRKWILCVFTFIHLQSVLKSRKFVFIISLRLKRDSYMIRRQIVFLENSILIHYVEKCSNAEFWSQSSLLYNFWAGRLFRRLVMPS